VTDPGALLANGLSLGECAEVNIRESSGFRIQGSGFRVECWGFRVQGSGFRVQRTWNT